MSNQGVEVVTLSRENNVDAVVSNVTGDSPSDEGVKQIAVCLVEEVMSKAISVSKCPSVNTESIDSSELINTKKRPKIFPCPRCGKKFAQFTSSTKHCLTVVPKDVSCSICFKKMDKRNLKRHLKVHENEKATPSILCELCNIKFSSKQKLQFHLVSKHNIPKPVCEEENLFKCTDCNFSHSKASVVKRHVTMNHTENIKIDCNSCEWSCVSKGAMYKHKSLAHKTSSETCDQTQSDTNQSNECEMEPSVNVLSSGNSDVTTSTINLEKSSLVSSLASQNLTLNNPTTNEVNANIFASAMPYSYSGSFTNCNSGGESFPTFIPYSSQGVGQGRNVGITFSNQYSFNNNSSLPSTVVDPWQIYCNRVYSNPEYGLYSHQINMNYASVGSRGVYVNSYGSEIMDL